MLRFALLASLLSAAPATPPPPTRWVTDGAGLLSPAARDALDRRLEDSQRATGHQVLVWIGRSTEGEPIERFAERAFKAWKVGRAGLDDGVVLFLFSEDRALRLEVGYGLEAVLPDAVCSRIIHERIAPLLASGDADGAVSGGVDALLEVVGGGPAVPPAPSAFPLSMLQVVTLVVVVVGFLALAAVRPDLALRFLAVLLFFGRGRRGGGGGGGGFEGRGGRSGGGGATGRWR